jgi:uncharacterized protein YkwD
MTASPAATVAALATLGLPTSTEPAGLVAARPSSTPSALPSLAAASATAATAAAVVTLAPAIAAVASAGVAASASPTPALIVVANVVLMPAPTATRASIISSVARANPAPTAVPPVSVAAPASGDIAAAELYTVALINAQRAARGLAALAANPTLMSIANGRVADMVKRGYTGHNDPTTGVALGPALMRAAGFGGLVGENWYGTRLGPPANAEVAMKWFMTDPPHYQNILNTRYDGVGVGIAFNGQQWLLVQDFAGN